MSPSLHTDKCYESEGEEDEGGADDDADDGRDRYVVADVIVGS